MPAPSADLGVRVSQSQLSGRASVGLAGLMKSCTMTETHRRTAAGAGGHGPPALEVWTARTVRYVWRPSRPTAAHTATHRHMLMQWLQAAYVLPQFHTSRIPRVSPAPPSRAPSSISRRFQNGRFSRIALTRRRISPPLGEFSFVAFVRTQRRLQYHSATAVR